MSKILKYKGVTYVRMDGGDVEKYSLLELPRLQTMRTSTKELVKALKIYRENINKMYAKMKNSAELPQDIAVDMREQAAKAVGRLASKVDFHLNTIELAIRLKEKRGGA